MFSNKLDELWVETSDLWLKTNANLCKAQTLVFFFFLQTPVNRNLQRKSAAKKRN